MLLTIRLVTIYKAIWSNETKKAYAGKKSSEKQNNFIQTNQLSLNENFISFLSNKPKNISYKIAGN